MKCIFLSDIHGIKTYLPLIQQRIEEKHIDKIIVLGDLFYIGPRNKMKEGYDIQYVLNFLNQYEDKIICIQGNCDSEIDHVVCQFPIIKDLGLLIDGKNEIYLTHGHIYNEDNWPYQNRILVYGHYHTPFIKEKNNNLFINPGSISLPKEGKPTYMIYDDATFTIYDIDNQVIDSKKIV